MFAKNSNEQLFLKHNTQATKSLVSTQRILFYLDDKGAIKSSIIKTESNQNDDLLSYTGNLYFFDPASGAAQAIWQLKEGKFVNSTSFVHSSPNARTSSCTWELYQVVCGDQCNASGGAALGGGDNGDYFPNLGQGCCYQYKGCGDGPGLTPSNPSTPSPFIPIFNPSNPSTGGGGGSGGGGLGQGIWSLLSPSSGVLPNPQDYYFEFGPPTYWQVKEYGIDVFDEENDYRLYKGVHLCEGFRYLINAAKYKNTEVGAYLTDKGLIIAPNSLGVSVSEETATVRVPIVIPRTTQGEPNMSGPFQFWGQRGNQKTIYKIQSFYHTHPRGSGPSDKDKTLAQQYYGMNWRIVRNGNPALITYFNGNGETETKSENDFLASQGCN